MDEDKKYHTEHSHWGRVHHEHREGDELTRLFHKVGHLLFSRGGEGRSQDEVISLLAGRTLISQPELRDILKIQTGSLSELIAKLEAKGLIIRTRSEDDRRVLLLSLTDAGKVRAAELARQKSSDPFAALSDTEREQLKFLLHKIADGPQPAEEPENK